MTRFIVLTFIFLGWGFWELSGGTDFTPGAELETAEARAVASEAAEEPPVLEMSAIDATRAETAPATAPITALTEAPAPAAPTPPTQAVTQASFVTADVVGAEPEAEAPETIEIAAEAAEPAPRVPARNEFAEGPIIIAGPEIIRPTEPESTALAEPFGADGYAPSLVRILGDNVNVRVGPGTDYSVLTQLLDGTEVGKVDERNGWVMIELRDGQTGWVADWLVAGL